MLKNLKNFSLPEVEEQVLKFWKTHGTFKQSLAKNQNSNKKFVFYEGPPTANGRPGLHHVLARAFKDIVPRFKTMQGYFVPRKAGWDTHGLPVEIEAEKELGFKGKQDIEKYGIAEFNKKCKELIWRYRADWEQLTDRMGYWLDMEHPYITYENSYIESLWWVMGQVNKRKLLKKLLKTVPWCTRCQTPLSSHELGQPGAYKTVKDNSVYIKFKLTTNSQKLLAKKIPAISQSQSVYILSWTTTPWTLPGNAALAVGASISYDVVYSGSQTYIIASELANKVLGETELVRTLKGKDLVGLEYEQLFDVKGLRNAKSHKVYDADFVTTTDGTGVVHTAVVYGEDDYKLGVKIGLPQYHTVDETGRFTKDVKGFAGIYVKADDTEKKICDYLQERGYLLKTELYEHEYPHCWRCGKPLLYYARESWFIEMSKLRADMLKNNESINWTPMHIKQGRFGEWLKDLKDWSISRNRYWGTPLPIWQCEKEHAQVVSGLDDLRKLVKPKNNYYVLRHGEATGNLQDKIASGPEIGHNISELTERGVEQVTKAARELKKQKINLIIASPYKRTQSTAKIVSKITKAKIITDKRLRELECGIFNWQPVSKYSDFFKNALERFTKAPDGGESLNQTRARMIGAIKDYEKKYKGKNILLVSHGDPIWLLDGTLRGLSDEEMSVRDYYPTTGTWKKLEPPVLPFDSEGKVDLHRPFIDTISFACPTCKKPMRRVKDVMDVWFDSGAMPIAQSHYPFEKGQTLTLAGRSSDRIVGVDFPADFIAEAIDQTRGWFYTLLAISTLLKKPAAYKSVICLGLILDKNGQKMSKSKGNVVSPFEMMNKYGADAVRWYFYTINDPGDPKNFDETELAKVTRRFILILYNSFVFWNSYARGGSEAPRSISKKTNALDRWILARLNATVDEATKRLEEYRIGDAAKTIESLSDDLSRWYIRRSRDRFQASACGDLTHEEDWASASQTLEKVLLTISKLLAPFMPFFSESLHASIVKNHPQSVHMEDWPVVEHALIDKELLKDMEMVRASAAQALAIRAEAKIKVRQPLAKLILKDRSLQGKTELLKLLCDEVNVKAVEFNQNMTAESGVSLDLTVTPELKEEGIIRELVRTIQGLRQDAKYQMSDEIILMLSGDQALLDLVQRHSLQLKKLVNAKSLELKRAEKFDAELEAQLDNWKIWLGVRKL